MDVFIPNACSTAVRRNSCSRDSKGCRNINKFILLRLEEILEEGLHIDAKSHLQELAQEKVEITPEYRLISESGPDHNKNFVMGAYIGDKKVGEGKGSSKQKAEEDAARQGLININWDSFKI